MGIETVSGSSFRITERKANAIFASLPALLKEVKRLSKDWKEDITQTLEYKEITERAQYYIELGLEDVGLYGEIHIPSLPFENNIYVLLLRLQGDNIYLGAHPGHTPGVEPIRLTALFLERESGEY